MEMVQFHPTGLLAGPDTRMTGTVLEEGLRGAGGHLLNGAQRALHGATTTRKLERATRDVVSRAIYAEMRAGRTTPQRRRLHQDGPPRAREGRASSSRAWSSAAPTAASISPAAWSRWCRRRTTSWAASICEVDTSTELPGLFVAGEDAERHARRQPARRQRRRQLHRVRRHRRRDHGRPGSRPIPAVARPTRT